MPLQNYIIKNIILNIMLGESNAHYAYTDLHNALPLKHNEWKKREASLFDILMNHVRTISSIVVVIHVNYILCM